MVDLLERIPTNLVIAQWIIHLMTKKIYFITFFGKDEVKFDFKKICVLILDN